LHPDVAHKVAELPSISRPELLSMWSQYFTAPPPTKLRKELLVPILAYRIQEKQYGGLSHSAQQRLKEIAKGLATKRSRANGSKPEPQTGTRLIRVWHGEVHEVIADTEGYTYRGKQYSSLSRIAREITGTPWSGPAFFGTKSKAK
jgi:hypothetical protein